MVHQTPTLHHYDIVKNSQFWYTQAMYFSAEVANALGRFVQLRTYLKGYDHIIMRFMQHHRMQVSYVHPSLVQHTGRESTGVSSHFPEAGCFHQRLPPVSATVDRVQNQVER